MTEHTPSARNVKFLGSDVVSDGLESIDASTPNPVEQTERRRVVTKALEDLSGSIVISTLYVRC